MLNSKESLCGAAYFSAESPKGDKSHYIVAPLRCHSWKCPYCRRVKAKMYRERMKQIFDGRGLFFWTLTYQHKVTPDFAWSHYNQAWNRLRTNLVKQCGKFDYIKVLESHNDSPYPHLHLIVDKDIRPTIFGKAAIHAGFGYQLTIKTVTDDGAKYYITKYLTKEWQNEEGAAYRDKYRCRIVSFSRGLLSPKRKTGDWKRLLDSGCWNECLEAVEVAIEFRPECRSVEFQRIIDGEFAEITIRYFEKKRPIHLVSDDLFTPDWYDGKGRGQDKAIGSEFSKFRGEMV